jgi:predicted SnoaL-like aldol condensation-catalyzing enzyme
MADGTISRKQTAVSFLRLAASGNAHEAFDRYVGAGFRHHNAYFRGDAESLMRAMDKNAAENPGKTIEFHRTLEDGDFVAVHSRVQHTISDPGAALVHIFRFQEDLIVELWDIAQEVPKDCPNEHGMF